MHHHNHPEEEAEILEELDLEAPLPKSPAIAKSSVMSEEAELLADGDEVTQIDTVIGYGKEACVAEGGAAAMEAKIVATVDRTNLVFTNSLIEGVELVLRATIEDPEYNFPGRPGTMGSNDELGNLRELADGKLDAITDLRSFLGADHCAFVVKQNDGTVGVGETPGSFMVVARTAMSSASYTFVHELGHNFGCHHAWAR